MGKVDISVLDKSITAPLYVYSVGVLPLEYRRSPHAEYLISETTFPPASVVRLVLLAQHIIL